MLRQFIRGLFFVLGWFEMFMVFKLLTKRPMENHEEQLYYPQSFFQQPTLYLLVIFTFFLGLLRLVWCVGDNTFPAWLFILAAHLGELTFLWKLASMGHFNPMGGSLPDLIQRVAKLEVGNANTRLVLFIVPVLILLLVVHGPGRSSGGNKAKRS
jgi:hypothetical protein